MTEPFRVVVADPPWRFSDSLPGPKRGAASHYDVMDLNAICTFELPPIAGDAWLFLWRVSSMQVEALCVVKAWGFRPYSEIVWRKLGKNGKPRMGMGRSVRNAHESCIIAKRGKPERLSMSVLSIFDAPVRRHSEKPGEFFRLVEQLAPGPYLELFSRRHREGWTCLGRELAA